MTHTFKESLPRGKAGEKIIDATLGKIYKTHTPRGLETEKLLGVDRMLVGLFPVEDAQVQTRATVEYKTDYRAHETNCAFLEVVVVDGERWKSGWAFSTLAQVIAYYIPGLNKLLILDTMQLRLMLRREWLDTYGLKKAQNDGYHGLGCAVPLDVVQYGAGLACMPVEKQEGEA